MASSTSDSTPDPLTRALSGLGFRAIGPASRGGRIADVAVHPEKPTTWYVAVGSGGVWKTTNAGTTWTPIFDHERSYSIGCVRLDPTNPETVWVGTGEAVSGRHVAWGDGVYRSLDGGASWEHMGLEGSEHIADILIDPFDSDVVHVAAEGPLWSSGGERGLFTTRDGGATWEPSLVIDEDTGVTSAVFAPDDPDTIYAATYQRRRNVRAFMGGGPGSGIHVTSDGGATWTKVTAGMPAGNLGKIGLAVTPADPDLVYATIEAEQDPDSKKPGRGFYRSTNRGRSWEHRNDYISGGTGPHYYQELFASPHDAGKVYQVDVFLHVTTDGGKTIKPTETGKTKHSDNHFVWIDPENPDHLLVGCDAGLYETFDDCVSFRHVPNLPISQFYRVTVDDSVPFTNILGGAQDLGTLMGPTRTMHVDGVRNHDWWVPLGADGYQVAFDPHEPHLSYMEWQVGNVMRHDRRTNELTDIQPIGAPGDDPERFNWDTPIVLSPHVPGRLYVASQRVWRSDDRGDSWTPISGDLTGGANRYELPVGDRVWSVDGLYDHMAMSWWATITSLSESPVAADVLYVGTDDGLVQVSEDGGGSWRRAGELPGLSAEAFVNDVEACRHRPDAVFVAADDHKNGDYTPYLFESEDRGVSWRSIRGDLPDGIIIWQIEQDHVDPDLLFLAAEDGLWVTLDRGEHWHRLGKGSDGAGGAGASVPTISMRDLVLQRRDDDLVAASFGRGFYVLDDYSPLRGMGGDALDAPATLFPVRQAWRYVPHLESQAEGQPTLGSTSWTAPNPDFGAVVTYHLSADIQSTAAARRAAEKNLDGDVPFPGHDGLWEEHLEADPVVQLVVRAADGTVVRRVPAPATAGLHRVAWDLRGPAPDPISLTKPDFVEPWVTDPQGPLVAAGTYSVELVVVRGGDAEVLAGPEPLEVADVPGAGADDAGFVATTAELARRVAGAAKEIAAARDRITHLRVAIAGATGADDALFGRLDAVSRQVETVAVQVTGDPVRQKLEEPFAPSIKGLVDRVAYFHWTTTAEPTATQRAALDRAAAEFEPARSELDAALAELAEVTTAIDAAGGGWTPR